MGRLGKKLWGDPCSAESAGHQDDHEKNANPLNKRPRQPPSSARSCLDKGKYGDTPQNVSAKAGGKGEGHDER